MRKQARNIHSHTTLILNSYRLLVETRQFTRVYGDREISHRGVWKDIVAVGREGVVCRGLKGTEEGDFHPLSASGILTEGFLAVSLSAVLVRATYDA